MSLCLEALRDILIRKEAEEALLRGSDPLVQPTDLAFFFDIYQRLSNVGGNIKIESTGDSGISVLVTVPLRGERRLVD